jgi:DNA invertase Pin-like site-specific DNA recombinase
MLQENRHMNDYMEFIPDLPSLPEDLPTATWMDKLTRAIDIGVVGFFRQSTDDQKRRHTGSQKVQEEQLEQLAHFDVPPEKVHVILAYGESGREGVVRQRFQELKAWIRDGRVGLLVLARHDRLSRNTADADEVFRLLVEYEVLLMVDGRVYDSSEAGDRLILGLYSQFAEYENRMRARWLALTRLAKAKALEFRVRLPTGLVWADPDDKDYQEKARAAGLSDWLSDLPEKPCSEVDGRKYYILPYPDAEVAKAIQLIRKWLLETRNEHEVQDRILQGYEGYPRPGLVPASRGSRPYPKSRLVWSDTTQIRDFVRSPALSGCYRFESGSLRPKARLAGAGNEADSSRGRKKPRPDVEVVGAFRSWFGPDEQPIVRRILAGYGLRAPYGRGMERVLIATSAVATLRCSVEIEPGKMCGRRIVARRSSLRKGGFTYQASACRQSRHSHHLEVSSTLDEHVLDVLRDVFKPVPLAGVARALRVDRASTDARRRALNQRSARGAKQAHRRPGTRGSGTGGTTGSEGAHAARAIPGSVRECQRQGG